MGARQGGECSRGFSGRVSRFARVAAFFPPRRRRRARRRAARRTGKENPQEAPGNVPARPVMILHYASRLLCLCLASFFVVNAVLGLTATFVSRAAIRIAGTMRARSAARFLFSARVLPCALGIGAVLVLCVPSYLWLEPQASAERIGWACLALALLGAASWLVSLARVTPALVVSARFNRACQETGRDTLLQGESS